MRAIEYGIKKFGGFSFNDSLTNIIVFNENISVEDPDKIQHVSQVKYLVECILNGNEFIIKSDGDVLTLEEFIYLSETEVVNIEKLKHLIIINGISSLRTIYKVDDQYFIFYDFSTVESLELNEVILSSEVKSPKKIIKSKPVLLNEKLKENKQTIIFFISSNGALIENAFKEIDQIRTNELVFFIEDKAESNIFGSVVRIASGSGFTSIQNIPFKEISKVVNVYENSIRPVDFEFMLKDHFNDKSGALYLVKRVFFGLLSEVIIIKDNLPLSVVEVFAETLAGLLSKLQFSETTWKYYDDEGNVAKNNSILLPLELLETKTLKKENIQIYTKKLNEIEQLLKQSLQANRALIKDNKILKKIITKIYDVIDSINDFISSTFEKGMEITKNFLIFYNAYIIGLINGFLKAVEDFFVLIAQLAKAIKFVQGETKKGNASNYWVMFFESIENFYDLLSNLITVKNLVALGSFLKKCMLLSPLVTYMAIHYFLENDFSITSDRLGYYIGYAIGIIIEIIVETILTGGATTVEQAVKLVFNQLKMIVQKLTKKAISFSDNIIEGIITVYAKLKHLFKNFPQFLDDLFELLVNYMRKLEDFIAIFSKETLALFGKHGVELRKIKQSMLYSGVPIPVGDNLYVLIRDGKEIFRGTKAEVDDFANQLKKMSDAEAKKFLDDLAKGNKLKLAEKMWEKYTYQDLMKIPPEKKPCFLAGTLVKTESGHLPIEQLKVGNKVYTFNFDRNQTEINTITRVYENVTQKYLKIKTQNSCIEATGQHRFWIPKQEKWLMANELKTGMHFLDVNKNVVEILALEIIESTEKTYNLEIENNHNYFVGQDEILTHNTNKVFKFADETLYDFGFYLLAETDAGRVKSDLYVGITTQPFDVRNSQHAQEGRAALKGTKPYNAWKAKIGTGEVSIFGIKPGYTKMTFYEATVWETYFINERGGGKAHKGLGKLLNRKTPISETMFDDMKATGKFNPCKYFI